MKVVVRTLAELGEDVVLAPERWLARDGGDGVLLGDLVEERRERASLAGALVLDTTHARDGMLDIAAALRGEPSAKSAKKAVHAGDLLVSRLRPYLRQIALVHPRALGEARRHLAVSPEFFVLVPREGSLGFLVPFLLSEATQEILAAAQEGGHHPRVPLSALLAIRVPASLVEGRDGMSDEILRAQEELYGAIARYQGQLR